MGRSLKRVTLFLLIFKNTIVNQMRINYYFMVERKERSCPIHLLCLVGSAVRTFHILMTHLKALAPKKRSTYKKLILRLYATSQLPLTNLWLHVRFFYFLHLHD
jgi:hypothetical protein